MKHGPVRVLVVDDSPQNRQVLVRLIDRSGLARVVGTAATGTEALRAAAMLKPDAVTLDLEMPQMDGFSFLRLLMATRPLPVLIVSGYDQKENVFRALELGAIDFVSKPEVGGEAAFAELLSRKLRLLCSLTTKPAPATVKLPRPSLPPLTPRQRRPRYVIAMAASTGGPTALTEVLSHLTPASDYAVVVAQHMPPHFTTTFAQRLNQYSALAVAEATHHQNLYAGEVLICPGNVCMELEHGEENHLRMRLLVPPPGDRYVPSATRLLRSVGEVMQSRAIGVVLTGMGDDGADGARVIAERGGAVLVESEHSAVVFGMPRAAAAVVKNARRVHLTDVARSLMDLVTNSD